LPIWFQIGSNKRDFKICFRSPAIKSEILKLAELPAGIIPANGNQDKGNLPQNQSEDNPYGQKTPPTRKFLQRKSLGMVKITKVQDS